MPLSSCSASRTGGDGSRVGPLGTTRGLPPTGPRAVGRTSDPPPVLNAPAQPPEARLDLDATSWTCCRPCPPSASGGTSPLPSRLRPPPAWCRSSQPAASTPRPDPIEAQFRAGEEHLRDGISLFPAFGDALGGPSPNMHRVHRGAHGGPDTSSCRSCHHRGGDDGAGSTPKRHSPAVTASIPQSANERNPPPLHGGGLLESGTRITDEFQASIRRPR